MNKFFISLSGFIKALFDFPHRLFSFPHRNRIDDRGVLYANQFRRSISIITDLLLCIFILKCSGYLLSLVFDFSFPIEVIERYRFKLPLTQAENDIMLNFYKKVLLTQVFQLILLAGVFVMGWHKFGCTPGKWVLRLRVLDDNTLQKPSISACIKRMVMLPLSLGVFFLGMFWSIFDKKSRTWHDIFAGTIVVLSASPIFKDVQPVKNVQPERIVR